MKSLKRTLTGRRRTVAAVLAATVVLGGAGAATATAFAEDGDHDDTPVAATTSPGTDHDDHDNDAALVRSAKVDIKQAADTATKSLAGTVTAVDLDGQKGKPVWKVDVTDSKGTEHEVSVNATDGKVTATKADRDNDSDDRTGDAALAKSAKSAKTDLAKAVDAALAEVKGTATSADLENDHGRTTAWHVDVTDAKGNDHEVTVDAANGKVTAAKTDDDRNDDSDSASGGHDED
ncbi:PepSY domain-containing protein [Streptomyces sp. NPDC052101]|uniref:PepSY domain-containing protein n=1 Tax=Streptomyces sp. NPDC052101 TaxID=3155763 RepID=UPI00343DDB75